MIRLALGLFLMAVFVLSCSPPPASTVCTESADCGQNEYCAKTAGDCDGEGTCELKTETCMENNDPVCGCDGNTYANACEASHAGVSVSAPGQCLILPLPPAVCTDNTTCQPDEFCSRSSGVCAGEGFCSALPDACPQFYAPVCGCDGITYVNECEASRAGAGVAAVGECVPPPAGGCTSNFECGPAQYCAKAAGDCDGVGSCANRPEMCVTLVDPVIGCDGSPYGNSCEAARAGVKVR